MDVLNLLGESGRRIVIQMISNTYETIEWPKVFTEVTVITLRTKPKTTICSDHHIMNIVAHTEQIVATVRNRGCTCRRSVWI